MKSRENKRRRIRAAQRMEEWKTSPTARGLQWLWYYRHDGRIVVAPADAEPTAMLQLRFNSRYKRVGLARVGLFRVSTVWLGLDHSFWTTRTVRKPILWETMVFPLNSSRDLYCERYSSLSAARSGHRRVVAYVRSGALERGLSDEERALVRELERREFWGDAVEDTTREQAEVETFVQTFGATS